MLHEMEPRKLNVIYKDKEPSPQDIFLCLCDAEILIRDTEEISFPTIEEILSAGGDFSFTKEDFLYLFSIDETAYYTVLHRTYKEPPKDFSFVPVRSLRYKKPTYEAYAALLGNQLHAWYSRNTYCGKCGAKTVSDPKERCIRCEKCGNFVYPQICPSVLVGVLNHGKMLITRYNPAHKMTDNGKVYAPPKTESIVAGYVESGETVEEAVRREVWEEAGLRVKNIRYYKSAPWPLSGTLLFGYFCEVDGDDTIQRETEELSEARWKAPEEIEDHSKDVGLTGEMIELFRTGRLDKIL